MATHLLLLLCLLAGSASSQPAPASPDLASLIHDLPTAARKNDMGPMVKLSELLADAPLKTVETDLPALIDLTESTESRTRFYAVASLMGLRGGENKPSPRLDTERLRLLFQYVPRLAPRLFDPATAAVSYFVLDNLAFIRPASTDLSRILLKALED